jgi:GH35 family endo-1,4-beta-xylanase
MSLALATLLLAIATATAPAALEIPADQATFKGVGKKLALDWKGEPGWVIDSNGEIGDYLRVPADGIYLFTIRCCGSPAQGGWPIMAIVIDNVPTTSAMVDKEKFADYTFALKLTAGVHRLAIAFLNDLAVPGPPGSKTWKEDRNLFVNRYALSSPTGVAELTLATHKDWLAECRKREEALMGALDQEIARVRKGSAAIRVVDAQGQPLAGAKVTAELQRHEFLFGGNIYMFDHFKTPQENELYQRRFAELFNYATVGFYWKWYEPQRGQPNYAYTDKVVAWCSERGIRMKGHPLLWANEAGVPAWSKDQPNPDLQKARVTEILGRYGQKIAAWEVVNEPAHLDGIAIDEPYRWARAADAEAYLIVNDYDVLGNGYPPFFELLQKAKAAGVPFDGIGIQAHEPRTMRFPLASVKDILDHYARLGKDLHITEFTPTSAGQPITGDSDGGTWDEETQAQYAQKFYRVCFAHPAVVAITWWDLCDEGAWLKGGGLLRKDLSPKPAYDTLRKLIHEEWHTQAEGQTDAAGRFAFTGFAGKYQITVTAGDKMVSKPYTVARPTGGQAAEMVIRMGPGQ